MFPMIIFFLVFFFLVTWLVENEWSAMLNTNINPCEYGAKVGLLSFSSMIGGLHMLSCVHLMDSLEKHVIATTCVLLSGPSPS